RDRREPPPRSLPGCDADGDALRCTLADPAAIPDLVAALVGAGFRIEEVRRSSRSLEEIYLEHVGRAEGGGMSTLSVIARREIRLALRNRGVLITAFIFAIWFPVMTALGIAAAAGGDAAAVAGGIAAITLPVGVFMGYIFCSDAFLREKRDGTIETLLCAPPVSLQRLWEGKALGGRRPGVPDDPPRGRGEHGGQPLLWRTLPSPPNPLLLLHLAAVVPVWIAAAAGLIGAASSRSGCGRTRSSGSPSYSGSSS
uniref:ABC transporter permease n=1 Tax=Methanoculleus chikugoensis TaxID=118126 RepID=UPI000A48BA1B